MWVAVLAQGHWAGWGSVFCLPPWTPAVPGGQGLASSGQLAGSLGLRGAAGPALKSERWVSSWCWSIGWTEGLSQRRSRMQDRVGARAAAHRAVPSQSAKAKKQEPRPAPSRPHLGGWTAPRREQVRAHHTSRHCVPKSSPQTGIFWEMRVEWLLLSTFSGTDSRAAQSPLERGAQSSRLAALPLIRGERRRRVRDQTVWGNAG